MIGARSLVQGLFERRPAVSLSYRFLRARWERGYLKDLYHRRILAGADPLMSRSAYPNWDYGAEVFAFGHRVGSPETSSATLVRALTTESFFSRPDVIAESSGVQPSKDSDLSDKQHNAPLVQQGEQLLRNVVSGYLRFSLPDAPEELICALCDALTGEELLSNLSSHLGISVLIRTAEFPPSKTSLSDAFKALLASLRPERSTALIVNIVLPQLLDIDIGEAFALREPLAVLKDLLHSKGHKKVEPRLLRSAGVVSAEPIYVVGIYADESLIGQSAGETLPVAVEMASRDSLFRLWGLAADHSLPFDDRAHSIQFDRFQKPNYFLKEKCTANTDLSLLPPYEEHSTLNVVEAAMRFKREIRPVVGQPLRRRLRHKFSRGSLFRRSFGFLVKPRPYTVC